MACSAFTKASGDAMRSGYGAERGARSELS